MRLLILLPMIVISCTVLGQNALIDSLQKVVASEEKDEQTMRAYMMLVNEYSRTNLAKAKAYAFQGVRITKERQMWVLLSGFYTQLVSLHQNTGNTDSVSFYLQALQNLTRLDLGKERAKTEGNYYAAAGLFYKKQGNYTAALPFLLKAAALAKKSNGPEAAAGQCLNIGNTYTSIGAYDKALRYHFEALRLFEAIGNKKGQSFCYQGIAEDFIELRQYDKALGYIKKSLHLKKELADKRGIGNALSGMGRIYLGLKKYDQSFAFLTQALQIAKDLQLKREEAKVLMDIGLLLAERKKMESAMDYYNKGKQLAIESNDSATIVLSDREMAALHKSHRAQDMAEKQLISNIRITMTSGNKKEELSLYKTLSDLYAKNGDAGRSLLYTRKYYEGKDSLLSKEVQMEISRLEEEYLHEKKEAEIALLKKDQQLTQAQLKRQQELQLAIIAFAALLLVVAFLLVNRFKFVSKAKRFVEMEKMRNAIAKDLHDDIGSTLSSINIMSRILLQQAGKGVTDTKGLQTIKDQSAAIMENMSDIVWAINPHNDTVEKMIARMKEFASGILDPLDIRYTFVEQGSISAIALDPQRKRDLFLIFKEAVNNAAKYSRCKNVEIVLSSQNNSLQLLVKDDGQGFDPLMVKKGNGLKNLDERSSAAGGSLTFTTASGKGTSVKLEVPIT